MNVLIKAAKILDASSPHHNTIQDIYIADGVIQKMGESLSFPDAKQISFKNLHISQGWFDSSVSFGEPGYEERRDLYNLYHMLNHWNLFGGSYRGSCESIIQSYL